MRNSRDEGRKKTLMMSMKEKIAKSRSDDQDLMFKNFRN